MRRYGNSRALAKTSSTEIAKGSLKDVSVQKNIGVAEAFANADQIVCLDESSSMGMRDAGAERGGFSSYFGDGQSRREAAKEQLLRLQAKYPGRLALFCFSDETVYCPNGVPERLDGTTDMAKALRVIREADGTDMGFTFISDGEPNYDVEEETLRIAKTFKSKIDCIYIGPHQSEGEQFMKKLASLTGGIYVRTDKVGDFYDDEERLLLSASRS
jgi:Mg-chelatase subunit ChlD